MLIIPAEQTINWRKPPVATLLLIFINFAIFFYLSGKDNRVWQDAAHYYEQNQMVKLEAPEFADYLQRHIGLGQDNRFELSAAARKAVNEGRGDELIPYMLTDRKFVNYLMQNGQEFIEPEDFETWKSQRTYLQEHYLSQLSHLQMGLIPGEMELADLLSYQFLHGGFGHVFGNMVMLFLLGFAIERILGAALYVMAYLFCGVVSGFIFSMVEGDSLTPLVGASGAVSGLMGMYVAHYRLQQIRFFAFLYVYFNYFRAPALIMLPVWVGKELYEYFTYVDSNVAYVAHAAGLVAGAAIIFPLDRLAPRAAQEITHSPEEQDQSMREELARAMDAVGRVDFQRARERFKALWEKHPDHIGIQEQLFHLYKVKPDTQESLQFTITVLEHALKMQDFNHAYFIWSEYQKYAKENSRLEDKYHFRILNTCLNNNLIKEAEQVFSVVVKSISNPELVRECYRTLIQALKARQMDVKAQKYERELKQLEG
ncbi:rhomboid family intramembrane serine protease [Hahella sp. NBU794]|uniref:rhomboid family intramembrane serine protease n=1 Tax=Hahella sp. NBU794 TaxID=3422590 RepID=UPI003D6FB455